MDSMFSAIQGGATSIWSTQENLEVLKQFARKGWIDADSSKMEIGKQYKFDTEKFKESEKAFNTWLDKENMTLEER